MSTKKKDRRLSPVEYINGVRNLYQHSLQYLPKLGGKQRTLIQVPLLDYVRKIMENVIFLNREKNKQKKIEYVENALSYLDIFEIQLSVTQEEEMAKPEGKQYVSDYGWLTFGQYIKTERDLLRGVHDKLINS